MVEHAGHQNVSGGSVSKDPSSTLTDSGASPEVAKAVSEYQQVSWSAANEVLGERLAALLGYACALAVPNVEMAKEKVAVARSAGASNQEIEDVAHAAALLRAGGALTFGVLGFKMVAKGAPSKDDAQSLEVLSRLDSGYEKNLRRALPAPYNGLVKIVGSMYNDAAIDRRTFELVAIVVAMITQCYDCIDMHFRDAEAAGATAEELAAVVHLACTVRAESTLAVARVANSA